MIIKKLLLGLALSSLAFSSTYALNNDTSSSNETNGQSANSQQAQNSQDGDVLAWLIVLNQNEITAANAIQKRNVSPEVKKYANMLDKEHSKNLKDTLNLSRKTGEKPTPNDESQSLKLKGKQELTSMKPLKDKEVEIIFIDTMVQGHSDALNKLDKDIPNVKNSQIKQHLEVTRDHIAQHLEAAKNIQNQLKSQS